YVWRTGRRLRLGALAAAIACVALLAIVAYRPLWIGMATLEGLRAHGRPGLTPSTPGALLVFLTRSHSEQMSIRLLTIAVAAAALCGMVAAALSVRDRHSLLRACGIMA